VILQHTGITFGEASILKISVELYGTLFVSNNPLSASGNAPVASESVVALSFRVALRRRSRSTKRRVAGQVPLRGMGHRHVGVP